MSAFIVSHEHLDALVGFGLHHVLREHSSLRWTDEPIRREEGWLWSDHVRELTVESADAVWTMLLAENIASVSYRYDDDDDLPGPIELDVLRGCRRSELCSPVTVLKAINCYSYQACEHPGWFASEAYQFCDALRGFAIRCLPGYEAATWEIGA